MQYIIGIILALIGAIWYNLKRSKVIETILNEDKTKDQLKEIDTQLKTEEIKRKELEDNAKQDKEKLPTKDNLLDFLNNKH